MVRQKTNSKVVGEDDRRWSCGEEWTSGGSYNPNCNDGPEGLSDQDGEHYMIRMANDAEQSVSRWEWNKEQVM